MCDWVKSGNQRIDPCMRREVAALNKVGLTTLACCCGHGRYEKTIVVQALDGTISEFRTNRAIPRKKRFYIRDKDRRFYIPEISKNVP